MKVNINILMVMKIKLFIQESLVNKQNLEQEVTLNIVM